MNPKPPQTSLTSNVDPSATLDHPFGFVTSKQIRDVGREAFGLTYPEDEEDKRAEETATEDGEGADDAG